MKKLWLILLLLAGMGCLWGCSYEDPVIGSLPACESEEFYTSGGFQDFTDYGKYTYGAVIAQELEESNYFRAVTEADVEEVLLYIENFEGWVEIIGDELEAQYDFDKSVVSAGDFLYIETKEGRVSGKFDNYTVYYFDMDAQTLYYFHNNI